MKHGSNRSCDDDDVLQWYWHDFMKVYLTKILFKENLRWHLYSCSGIVVICTSAYFDTILQEIWECSAREQLEAGWIMTWGQDQGGQNSFDVEKGTFFAR